MSAANHRLSDVLAGMDNIRNGGAGDYEKFDDYTEALEQYLERLGLNPGEVFRLVQFYSIDASSFKQ